MDKVVSVDLFGDVAAVMSVQTEKLYKSEIMALLDRPDSDWAIIKKELARTHYESKNGFMSNYELNRWHQPYVGQRWEWVGTEAQFQMWQHVKKRATFEYCKGICDTAIRNQLDLAFEQPPSHEWLYEIQLRHRVRTQVKAFGYKAWWEHLCADPANRQYPFGLGQEEGPQLGRMEMLLEHGESGE